MAKIGQESHTSDIRSAIYYCFSSLNIKKKSQSLTFTIGTKGNRLHAK